MSVPVDTGRVIGSVISSMAHLVCSSDVRTGSEMVHDGARF